jgi:hypothetical protein
LPGFRSRWTIPTECAESHGSVGCRCQSYKGVLAVTATLVAEPILFVLEALTMRRGRRVGRSPGTKGDDLKSREYRDNRGQTHHHTRTFMRDHAGELRALPA